MRSIWTFRPSGAVGRALEHQILTELGEAQTKEEKKWTDLTARGWALLRGCYAEVQAAGLFIFRNDSPEEKFPSLYVGGGRPARGSKSKPEAEGDAAPEALEGYEG